MAWSGDGRWLPVASLVAGTAALATAIGASTLPALAGSAWLYVAVVAITAAVSVGGLPSTRLDLTLPAAVLALTLLPPAWAVVTVAAGTAAGYLLTRWPATSRSTYHAASTVLAGAASATVAGELGLPAAVHQGATAPAWGVVAVAAATFVVVRLGLRVVARILHDAQSWRHALCTAWDQALVLTILEIAAASLVTAVVWVDVRLAVTVPPLILTAGLVTRHRAAMRRERAQWQLLAAVTDALHGNTHTVTSAARASAAGAVALFDVRAAELEMTGPSARLIRASDAGIIYEGPPAGAEVHSPTAVIEQQPVRDTAGHLVGSLRLIEPDRAPDRVVLSAYCTAVGTAIGNAVERRGLVRAAERYEYALTHDAVTGLPNRQALTSGLVEALKSGRPVHLVIAALTNMPLVNDSLGHAAGDRLLAEVARRVRGAFLRDKQVVARLDGNRLAILLTGMTEATAAYRAKGALKTLRQPVEVEDIPVAPGAVAGMATADVETTADELLRRAHVALQQAKDRQDSLVAYHPALDTADRRRLALAAEAPAAVADGSIQIWYQPLVDLLTGRVTSVSAKPRWDHPRYGVVPADDWLLQVVTGADLLTAWTDRVLTGALAGAARWRDAGWDLPLTVPVSPRCLQDPTFAERVLAHLDAVGFPANRLVLEMAETSPIMPSAEIAELRAAGVMLGLNEFGTGRGSLATLVRIRFDGIKIDRSFVADMAQWPAAASVVRAAVDLARDLTIETPHIGSPGHTVVAADGVNTEEQRYALVEMGCTIGQGGLTGGPMPADAILAALENGSEGRRGHVLPACPPSVVPFPPGARHRASTVTA